MIMNQEILAGAVMCIMGLCMLFVQPTILWSITEKWKTRDGENPSRSYVVIVKVLGIVFTVVGLVLVIKYI